jgi:hypothetical protein
LKLLEVGIGFPGTDPRAQQDGLNIPADSSHFQGKIFGKMDTNMG